MFTRLCFAHGTCCAVPGNRAYSVKTLSSKLKSQGRVPITLKPCIARDSTAPCVFLARVLCGSEGVEPQATTLSLLDALHQTLQVCGNKLPAHCAWSKRFFLHHNHQDKRHPRQK